MESSQETSSNVNVCSSLTRGSYVQLIKHRFATNPKLEEITISALGNAIVPAIIICHLIQNADVAKITSEQTFYECCNENPEDENSREISRIKLTLVRNKEWTPAEIDSKEVMMRRYKKFRPGNRYHYSKPPTEAK